MFPINGIVTIKFRRSFFLKGLFVSILSFFIIFGCERESPTGNGGNNDPIDFENSIRLTENISDIKPRWSPSGKEIVFERSGYVYLLDIESGSIFLMAQGRSPCWYFNGQYIGFIRDSELYRIYHTPGSFDEKLTLGAHASGIRGCDLGKGERFAYFHTADSTSTNTRLIIYQINSDTYHWIIEHVIGYGEVPRWSIEGTRVLFNSSQMGPCIVNINTEMITQLLPWETTGCPCWFNSTSVLYAKGGYLYKVDADGKNKTIIYGKEFHPGTIDYCPEVKKLTFSYRGIWVMDMSEMIDE